MGLRQEEALARTFKPLTVDSIPHGTGTCAFCFVAFYLAMIPIGMAWAWLIISPAEHDNAPS